MWGFLGCDRLLSFQDKWVLDHEDVLLGERIGQVNNHARLFCGGCSQEPMGL